MKARFDHCRDVIRKGEELLKSSRSTSYGPWSGLLRAAPVGNLRA